MAIIDIDRHIVTDMACLIRKIEKYGKIHDANFLKTTAYTAQLIECHRLKQCDQIEILYHKRQRYIKKAYNAWRKITELQYEMKALLMHIINRIKKVDTGKGKEYKKIDGGD